MRRLFAAGCSYTGFNWPTWADYLGVMYDEYQNLGAGGAGNRFIFNRIGYLLANNEITAEDTVIVQWSGLTREDRIFTRDRGWTITGNIHYQDIYDDDFVNNKFNVVQMSCELISYVTTLELAFKQIGCEYYFLNMFDYHIEDFLGEPACPLNVVDQVQLFRDLGHADKLKEISEEKFVKPSIEVWKWDYEKDQQYIKYSDDLPAQVDDHPSPYAHYTYARDVIAPLLKNSPKGVEALKDTKVEDNAREWTSWITDKEAVENSYFLNVPFRNTTCPLPWPKDMKILYDTVDFKNRPLI